MAKPVIITCAPTGGIHTPTMSDHLPITPDEIATASIEAAEAGASIIHLHARDPETGKPDPDPDLFMRFLPRIKQSTDAVVNVSTGGGLGMTREERLRAATRASPEMASLNVGSMNFGIFPMANKYSEWKFDWEPQFLDMTRDFIFRNTFADLEYVVKELGEGHGTKFEFECYDLGHLYKSGLADRPGVDEAAFLRADGVRCSWRGWSRSRQSDAYAHHRRQALR